MPKNRSPDRDKAKELYLADRTRSLKSIAEELGVSEGTLRGWKNKDKWDSGTEQKERNAPNKNTERSKPKIIIDDSELNDKQILFCIEYLKCFNATKAYQKVYQCDYSTALASGSRLLGNVRVSAEIERLKQEQRQSMLLDANILLQKQIDIAFASITDYVSFGRREIEVEGGRRIVNYVHLRESDEVDGSLLTEVKEGREGVSVKLMDKHKAFDFLDKHFHALDSEHALKLDKLRAEIKKLEGSKEGEDIKDWKQAIKEKAERRKAGMQK